MSRWLRVAENEDRFKNIFDSDLSYIKDAITRYIRFNYLAEHKPLDVQDIFNKLYELCKDSKSPANNIYKTILEWLTNLDKEHVISVDEHQNEGWVILDDEKVTEVLEPIREEANKQLQSLD